MPVVSRSMRLTDRGIYWVLAAALAAAGLIPEFRSLGNLANVATQSAALAVLAVGHGAGSGAVTGLLNNRLRIHPLILTFGTMSVLQGIVFTYTDRSVGRAPAAIAWLADGRLLGLPVAPLLVLVLAAGAHVTLTRTRFGMHVRAVGGGRDNARRAGIDTDRVAATVIVIR